MLLRDSSRISIWCWVITSLDKSKIRIGVDVVESQILLAMQAKQAIQSPTVRA